MQASWSGSIVFGMVSVPVQLFKATEPHAGPRFHQVHEKDGGRIRLKRFCEAEDAEVPYAEIAKGYDAGDEQQLIITAQDLEALPIPSRNTIEVMAFVDADAFDPMQFDSAYYVGLGKRSPGKPYALLREAMREDGKVAVSKVTLTSRESLAVLRVVDDLLVLHTMLWPDEVRTARGIEPPSDTVHANELRMAHSLMDALSEGFNVNDLHDEYRAAVEEMIEAKLHGQQPATAARPEPASNVMDITAILQRSLDAQKARHTDEKAGGTAKKTAGKKTASASASASTSASAGKTAAKKGTAAKKSAASANKTAAKKSTARATTHKAG